ncbi:hypothetical protein ACFYZ9_33740 [Streptomyces sp. NPDC001691]|uniref:hypothetical protein n=1 Tax=Streptomyces sp. NPDC001691 TaxID=3364600 RepID=UPI0036A53AF5
MTTNTSLPEAGAEYPYAICTLARRASELLGEGWSSTPGRWGVTGRIQTPDPEATVLVYVDDWNVLCVLGPTSLEPWGVDAAPPRDEAEFEALAALIAEIARDMT